MKKLNNVRRINSQDFDPEMQDTIEKLSYILNSFMQEVVDLSNKNIDFENLNQNLVTINIEVDSLGKPIGVNRINVGKNNPKGMLVIRAINTSNNANISSEAPFIYFSPNGTNLVVIDKIVGLIPNNTYNLTIVIF